MTSLQFTPEFIASLTSTVSVVVSVSTLAYWLGGKFKEIEMRFRQIDERFKEIDRKFAELEEKLSRRIERLGDAFVSYQEFFVKYLVSEGVLKPSAADVAITEARNLMKLAVSNPFTKEEWKRLKELLDKGEKEKYLTLEEAYELLNLARKAIKEYGDHPEAWSLHIYASIMVGLAYRRMKEEKEKEEKKAANTHP